MTVASACASSMGDAFVGSLMGVRRMDKHDSPAVNVRRRACVRAGRAASWGVRDLDWNLIVTAQEGMAQDLRRALRPVVALRGSGFRNVFAARVDDPDAALVAAGALLERQPFVALWLARMLPIARTFTVDLARLDAQLTDEVAPLLDRLAGRTFFVRVERRGHRGAVHAHATEQTLGTSIFTALERRGDEPRVRFTDPDVVVAVELLGDVGGLALVTRDQRRRFPFVRVS
jgi:tRNA(Ser,Leu) C12 N-acetylase TAN1